MVVDHGDASQAGGLEHLDEELEELDYGLDGAGRNSDVSTAFGIGEADPLLSPRVRSPRTNLRRTESHFETTEGSTSRPVGLQPFERECRP